MDHQHLSSRVQTLEVDMGKVSATLDTVVDKLGMVASDVSSMSGHVSRLEAGQGKIPVGIILAAISTLFTAFGVVLVLTLNPITAQINELKTANKTAVEEQMPDLAARLASHEARITENETELGHVWSDPNVGLFGTAVWKGSTTTKIDKLIADVAGIKYRTQVNGWSRQDQNAYEVKQNQYDDLLKSYIDGEFKRVNDRIDEDKDDLDDIRKVIPKGS